MKTVTLKCYRCGKDSNVDDMRYVSSNRMICKTCVDKAKNPEKVSAQRQNLFNTYDAKKPAQTVATYQSEPTVEYVCNRCNYLFKRKKSVIMHFCPYCSKEGTLDIKSGTPADRLIKESLGENYDS